MNLSGKRTVSGHDSEKLQEAPKEQIPDKNGENLSGQKTEEDDRLFCHLPF